MISWCFFLWSYWFQPNFLSNICLWHPWGKSWSMRTVSHQKKIVEFPSPNKQIQEKNIWALKFTPWKIWTFWTPKNAGDMIWNMIFLFNLYWLLGFHVHFQEGSHFVQNCLGGVLLHIETYDFGALDSLKNQHEHMVFLPQIGGKPPKMDGENNGKPYCLMDDLGGNLPLFSETLIWFSFKKSPPPSWLFFFLAQQDMV